MHLMTLLLSMMMTSYHKGCAMNRTESILLAMCVGTMMGSFIGNIIMLIKYAVEDHKEKKRRRKEELSKEQETE